MKQNSNELNISGQSLLSGQQRQELATFPTTKGKIAYLEKVMNIKPENIVDIGGRAHIYTPETNEYHPINPEGFESGDIRAAIPKGLVTGAQIAGGIGGTALGNIPGGVIGAGGAGAGAEALLEKLNIEKIKKQTGQDLSPYFSGKEVLKEGAVGGAGELGGVLIGKAGGYVFNKIFGKKVLPGIAKVADTEKTIETSKLLTDKLENSTLENLTANPYVREKAIKSGKFFGQKAENFAEEAAKSTSDAAKGIKKIQSDFYKKAGITDQTPVPFSNVFHVNPEGAIEVSPSIKLKNILSDFADNADGLDEIKALKEATNVLKGLENKISSEGTISFKTAKRKTQSLYDLKEKYLSQSGTMTSSAKMFDNMRKVVAEAKNSVPQIQNAGMKYREFAEVEDKLNNILKLSRDPEEINLERKLARRYKDLGNLEFKTELNEAANIFKKYPETQHLSKFADDIKTLHAAVDVEKAKNIIAKPKAGIKGVPGIKQALEALTPSPETVALELARNAAKGRINPEAMMGTTRITNTPIIGGAITKLRGYRQIFPAIDRTITGARLIAEQTSPITKRIIAQSMFRLRGENQ